MFQSAFTGFCPAATVMHKFGIKTEIEREQGKRYVSPDIALTQ
jgi:hypothetical protein